MIASNLVSSRCGSLSAKRRSTYRSVLRSLVLSAALGLSAFSVGQPASAQDLFIGDGGDNSVKHFDASTGKYLGPFVEPSSAGLKGPRGMIFTDGQLVVVNQNVNTGEGGEILRFDGTTGTLVGKLVAASDRNAPFAPRGIVRGGPDNGFYVADLGLQSGKCANQGDVKEYNAAGAFLGNLPRKAFTAEFHPRGLVFGPHGSLYVSSVGCLDPTDPLFTPSEPLVGYILRFDFSTQTFDVLASNTTVPDLHRPEGLVFDSAGNLWVTSFRADKTDSDKILKLDGTTGALLDEIILSTPPAPRAYAQAILFGPDGNLYVPITGGDSTTTGQLLRCNPKTKQCDPIDQANAAGGPLQQPWYLIFKNSDPATLNYNNKD